MADKILYDGTLLSLAALKLCPVWAAATVLTRDISVLAGVILVGIRRRVIISPVLIGKLTSCGLALTVILYVAGIRPFAQIFLYITLGLVLISGINYLMRFWKVLREGNGSRNETRSPGTYGTGRSSFVVDPSTIAQGPIGPERS